MGRQKTVLFQPINAMGHINALLGLADFMREKHNHRTVFLVIGKTRNVILEHGHELIIVGDKEQETDPNGNTIEGINLWTDRFANNQAHEKKYKAIDAYREFVCPVAKKLCRDMLACDDELGRAVDSVQPDLIVTDAAVPSIHFLKNELDRPWVRVYSPNPYEITVPKAGQVKPPKFLGASLMNRMERERLRRVEPDKWQQITDDWSKGNEIVKQLVDIYFGDWFRYYEQQGYQHRFNIDKLFAASPYLNIYFYPAALDYDQEHDLIEYPANVRRCDGLIRKPAGASELAEISLWSEKIDAASKGKEAVVYVSLGTIASGNSKLLQNLVNILARDKRRLYVVSKGMNGTECVLSDDNMIGAKYLPQTYILQRSQLAIVHGGNNSVNECMHFGVPMIITAAFGDQYDNAQRLVDLNLGRRLDLYDCPAELILSTIESTLNDSELRNKIEKISAAIRSKDEFSLVTEMLNELMKD